MQPLPDALTIHGAAHASIESIEAESIGWLPLGEGAYLHVDDDNATQVLVVGVAQVGEAVLLVGCY